MSNKPLRICLLSSSYPRYTGDYAGVFVHQLASHLQRLGQEVYALVPHHPSTLSAETMDGVKIIRFPYFYPKRYQSLCYGYGIATNLKHSSLAKVQLPLFSVVQLLVLARYCRQLEIDVINSHWMVTQGLNAALVSKWYRIGHVSTVHAAGIFALRRFHGGKAVARFITGNSDYIFAVSSYVRRSILEVIGQDMAIDVLPMGIETERFYRESHSQINTDLLFLGRLVEKKGVQHLVDAVYQLVPDFPDIRLMIAGDGDLREQLESQVRKLGLGRNIKFLGKVSNDIVPELYAKCKLVIVPSIIDSKGETEGMPVVVLEALAAGRPVIASDVSGISDVVTHGVNGYLVKSGSASALANVIREALSQESNGICQEARITAQKFDWSNVAARYLEACYTAAGHQ